MARLDPATVDHLLTTTRSVRKRLDLTRPVDPAVLERCIEIALQAPTGSNAQGWHFVVVTERETRVRLTAVYRRGLELLLPTYASRLVCLPGAGARRGTNPGRVLNLRDRAE